MQWSGEASAEANTAGEASAETASNGRHRRKMSAEADSDASEQQDDPAEKPDDARRRGMYIGLDPGAAIRFDDGEFPVYARLQFRVGGCFSPRLHLGVDWRTDIFTANAEHVVNSRHSVGPVLTAFLIKGWFVRPNVHVGGFRPVYALVGAQTGYEFPWGKLGAVGFALGGDADIQFDGPPLGYTVSAVLYLTAYDLRNRRDRD